MRVERLPVRGRPRAQLQRGVARPVGPYGVVFAHPFRLVVRPADLVGSRLVLAQAKTILSLLRELARGRTESYAELCRLFVLRFRI